MMAFFRALVKSWVARVLLGLLIVSFAVWGVQDAFHGRISDSVVTAGKRAISSAEFKRIFDAQVRNAQQQSGQALTAQDAVNAGLDRRLLADLADSEAVAEVIRRSGVGPSNALLVAELRKIPAFFNQLSGAFDQQAYQAVLAENQLTPSDFEKGLRDQLAEDHFSSGMVAGFRTPRTYAALLASVDQEQRVLSYFVLDARKAPTPAKPTDAELTKFMKENDSRLRRPEFRAISLVRFSADALAQTMTADPAEVKKRFDYAKDKLSTPEKRAFVQIPVKGQAQAQAVAARLGKGEDPAAVAQSIGVKPITYADTAKGGVADAKVADAAFALKVGEASGPVQGEFGLAVVKVSRITPPHQATLEEVRSQIEPDVKLEAAQEKVYDQVQKYDDAHAAGAPLVQAAKTAGVQIYPLGPMTSEGRLMADGQPVTGLNKQMLDKVFAMTEGEETDVIDLGKGEYYAMRLDKVTPSALPSLDEVRGPLTQAYMTQALVTALQKSAEDLAARVKKGESLDKVAASAGGKVERLADLSRSNADKHQELGRDLLTKAFAAKPGEVFVGGVQTGMAVAKLDAVKPGDTTAIAKAAEQMRPQMSVAMVQSELGDMLRYAARATVKPRVDEARARQIIGMQPEPGTPGALGSGDAAKPAP
jgi:peptidyl-prolyl cis-trans isomerase D